MAFGLGLLAFLAAGCNIRLRTDYKLGVPFRAQDPTSFDCGPASVLMWRLYHGLPEVSQQAIGQFMGGTSCGASQDAIANAVRHYTISSDAFWDFIESEQEAVFMSRQISSLDARVPVIAIINGGFHAGVLNGGKWRSVTSGYQWDYAYFHDPLLFANVYYVAADWVETSCVFGGICQQIVSSGAIGPWYYNLQTFGDDIGIRGRTDWPPEEWPPAV